jgi:Mg-chelatase subunit ChlI/Mg-chelatase subunit ChlD
MPTQVNNEDRSTKPESIVETLEKPVYPFAAIVGKERAKLGLILNAIDPTIGGILLTGPKGSGKSTLVRAATRLFPDVETVEGCAFSCSPSDPTNMCDVCQARFKSQSLPKAKKRPRLIQIPIGATEDRIVGSLDVERVLKDGLRALHPGLLAEANQGILYLDETNLLPDHLVDTILDTSASGWNIVEREGISATHPARFVLIGTMNPEEGELRPQLMDRFGLHVQVENISDPAKRIEVIRRNIEFSENPDAFIKKYEAEDASISNVIAEARELLPRVVVPPSILDAIARVHSTLQVDGYRPDIITVKAARAHAAYMRRLEVTSDDIKIALELTLTHRTRRSGLKEPPSIQEIGAVLKGKTTIGRVVHRLDRKGLRLSVSRETQAGNQLISPLTALLVVIPAVLLLILSYQSLVAFVAEAPFLVITAILASILIGTIVGRWMTRGSSPAQVRLLDLARITSVQGRVSQVAVEDSDGTIRTPSMAELRRERSAMLEAMQKELVTLKELPKDTEPLRPPKVSKEGKARRGTQYLVGKRAKIVTSSKGRYTDYELPKKKPWDIALVPTLRAASPFQRVRKADGVSIVVKPEDLRVKIKEYRAPFSIVLLVDMSFSMASCIVNIGRAIFSLHRSVYRRRDRVSLIYYKGKDAVVLQQPTTNLNMAVGKLRKIETSDFTPMATGMLRAWRLLRLEKQRNKDVVPMLIIVSDGIVNVALSQPLSATSRKYYMSEAQADVIDMAHILRRDGIRVIVINTSHRRQEIPGEVFRKMTSPLEWYTPTELMLELAQITDGSYYGLSLTREGTGAVKKSKLDDWFFFEASA